MTATTQPAPSDKLAELESKLAAAKREIEIEAALEKVRSRSHAMHHSSELREIVKVVLDALIELDFVIKDGAVSILEFVKGSKDQIQWFADREQDYPEPFKVEFSDHAMVTDIFTARESGSIGFMKTYPFEEKRAYFEYLFEQNPTYRSLPDSIKNLLLESKEYGYSIAICSNSAIMVATNLGQLLSQDEFEILHRFAKVFDQAYTRFLDLQKAETQARETEIELALERVRARTMAMQRSDELKTVIATVFEKLKELQLDFHASAIQIFIEDSKDSVLWVANPEVISEPLLIQLPYEKEVLDNFEQFKMMWRAKNEQKDIFNKTYSYEEKNKYYDYVTRNNPHVIPEIATRMFEAPSYTHTVVVQKSSMLIVDSWDGGTISETDYAVVKRFAKVFDQSYTRFLDLQKAEAQAREAQIEAALERVRSRSMGMQRGEELKIVVKELYDQLKVLGFKWGVASIVIMDPNTGDIDWWMEGLGDGFDLPEKYHVPYFNHRGHKEQFDHWKNGSAYAVVEISGEEKRIYDEYYFFQTDFLKAPEHSKQLMMSHESVIFSMAYMKYGALS
jgi:hypothetical protein